MKRLMTFLRDEEGLTMTEYAIAGTLITLTAVVAFQLLGTNVSARINQIAGYLTGA